MANENKLVTLEDLGEAYNALYNRDVMTGADKTKLDGIQAGAQVNTVTGIKGAAESDYRDGNVSLDAEDVGAISKDMNYTAATLPYANTEKIALRGTDGNNYYTTIGELASQIGGGSGGTTQAALVHYVKNCGSISGSGATLNWTNSQADNNITENMVVLKAELSNPAAQTSDWTCTTTNGYVTITGTIASGSSTNVLLYFGVSLSTAPSIIVNLASTNSDNVLKTNPTPGVMGVLGRSNGGTGVSATDAADLRSKLGITPATTSAAGLMSADDKTKLNGIQAGAQVNNDTGTTQDLHIVVDNAGGTSWTSVSSLVNYLYKNYFTVNSKNEMTYSLWTVLNLNDSANRYRTVSNELRTAYLNSVGSVPNYGTLVIRRVPYKNQLVAELIPVGSGNYPKLSAIYQNGSVQWNSSANIDTYTNWTVEGFYDKNGTVHTITNNNAIKSGTITCYVRAGWAYVCITALTFKNAGDNQNGVASGFPAPKYRVDVTFGGDGHSNAAAIRAQGDSGWINANANTLNVHLGSTNGSAHYATFSYPVA